MLVKDVCCAVTWHVIIFPSYKQYCLFTWRRSSYKSHKQGRWSGPPGARACLAEWFRHLMPIWQLNVPHAGTVRSLQTGAHLHTLSRYSHWEQVCSLSLSLCPINYLFFPPCLRRLEQFLRQKEEKLKNGCRNWGFLCDGKPTQRTYTTNLVQIRNIEKHPVQSRGGK